MLLGAPTGERRWDDEDDESDGPLPLGEEPDLDDIEIDDPHSVSEYQLEGGVPLGSCPLPFLGEVSTEELLQACALAGA